MAEKEAETAVAAEGEKLLLFATHTCPNCAQAVQLLDDAGIRYEKIYAEENRDLAKKYGIMSAPTLVMDDGSTVSKFRGVGEVRTFTQSAAVKQ